MAKTELPRTLPVTAHRVMPGGFNSAGLVALTYEDDISGIFEVITRRHLYNWQRGIDVYPTPEQLAALLEGRRVVFGMSQWA